jgi:carboxymethylenebutenolidase
MRIHFKTPSGHECEGELETPAASGKSGGVVLVQEYWGVNDHIRDLVKRFSHEGFRVLAPDLYHGKTTKSAEEAGKLMAAFDWKLAVDEIAGAAEHLRTHETSNGKVAVMGFCMGGALAFAAACNVPDLAAAVPFYGVPNEAIADYTKVTAPILAHFSKTDRWATLDKAEAIKKKVPAMELFAYDAEHAFFNDTRPEVYSAESATLAWERTIEFLKKHLS